MSLHSIGLHTVDRGVLQAMWKELASKVVLRLFIYLLTMPDWKPSVKRRLRIEAGVLLPVSGVAS